MIAASLSRLVNVPDGVAGTAFKRSLYRFWAGASARWFPAYVVSFLKEASGSGCSSGRPPANLGIRLVRENDRQFSVGSLWRRWVG